jgi:streptomycin 6-kinase
VARLCRIRRCAHDRDRLRITQDLLRAPHYHRTVPEEELVARWQLTLGERFPAGAGGIARRVTRADGTPAVLKIGIPHRESEQEGDALGRIDGDGAIRLLDRDDEQHALLLELCEPGMPLSSRPLPEAMDVLVGLLPRIWKSAEGFHTLVDEIECWAELEELGGRELDLARELASSQGELVLTHQDLHGDNVLAAQREPWLVIDPKPLAAEREFQAAPILRSGELGHSKKQMLYRLDRLTELGLDRERMIGWTIAQTTAWSEGATLPTHGAVLDWLS